MAGKRPDINIVLKGKDSGRNQGFMAFWESQYGFNGKFDRTVKSITFEVDGKEVTLTDFETVYINMYDNRESDDQQASEPSSPDKENIPF